MLAERTGLQMGAAFQLIRDYARRRGARLSDVAARIIDGTLTELAETSASAKRN